MRAAFMIAAVAAASALPAYAECGDGLFQVFSAGGEPACVGERSAAKLLERGWSHALRSISVHDTVVIASTADSLQPSDSVVARVLAESNLEEEAQQLVYESYRASKERYLALTTAEKEWLRENPRILVAYELRWPPLEYADGDGIGGLTAAYVDAFEEFTGAEFVPVHAITLTDGVNKIRSGEADMSFMTVDSEKRLDYMYFTEPHTSLSTNLITYGESDISIEDLGSVTIGTVRGTEVEEWLDSRHSSLEYVSLHDYLLAFEELRDGRIDVLIDSWIVASHVAAADGFEGLHNAGPAGHVSPLSIGCSKADLMLCRILEKSLATIPEERREAMLLEAIADSAAHEGSQAGETTAAAVHAAYLATKQTVDHLVEEELEWLDGRDEVRVVYESSWPPIEFDRDDGSLGGLTAAYAEAFTEFTGTDFVPYPTQSWAAGLAHLSDGRADVSFMIVETDERRRYLGFTEPHTIISYSFITYGENQLSPEDIGSARVGTIRGYEIETWLDLHHPGTDYVSLGSHDIAFQALEEGPIDALIEAWPVVSHLAREAGFEGLHYAGTLGRNLDLAVAYTKTEPVLADIVRKALDSIPVETREEMLVRALVGSHQDPHAG